VIFFQVAQAAIVRVYNFLEATSQIAQTTLRAVLRQSSLDELLGDREKINQRLREIIDRQTEPWGIKVGSVELKDAQLAESMVRALARQAEAEREKRAEIMLAGDRLVGIDGGTALDPVIGQRQVETPRRPIGLGKGDWRNQHPPPRHSAALDDQISNGPAFVVQ